MALDSITTHVIRREGLSNESQEQLIQDEVSAFITLLRVCAKSKDLTQGRRLHDEIKRKGLLDHCFDALVLMYAKCGALATARDMLYSHKSKDVLAWTTVIAGYAQHGHGHESLHCFEHMQLEGIPPTFVTFACALKACGTVKAIEKGEEIHDEIARQGLLGKEVVLGNALVDMYAKCGALAKASRMLHGLPSRNIVTWNALIGGYAKHGQGQQALVFFEQMQHEGFSPTPITYISVLKACGSIQALDKGKKIHDLVAHQGLLQHDLAVGTAVVDMYAKCGELAKAQKVLEALPCRDVITWSALIAGYAHKGQGEQALKCFDKMQHEGLSPNAITFACLIHACGSIGAVHRGEEIHKDVSRQGMVEKDIVLGTALVDMYAKCGALEKARQVFEELPSRDVITWSALITGYAQHGHAEQALLCFDEMQREGLTPNLVTYSCILKACGSIGADEKGEQIYNTIARKGFAVNTNIVLSTALVDMYAKCGAFTKAEQLLEKLQVHNVVPWNALLTGYTQWGQNEQALSCFEQIQSKGMPPNTVTFSCVLNACSRLGLVEKGKMYFLSMSKQYGLVPNLEHYVCMIDLYGRAGDLHKAVQVIQEMPRPDYLAAWSTLLGACQKWGDIEIARWAFQQALSFDKTDGAAYVLMGNIYAAAGLLDDAESIEAMRKENRAWKQPEYCWWFDMSKNPHSVVQGNRRRGERKLICRSLGNLSCRAQQKPLSLGRQANSCHFWNNSKYYRLVPSVYKGEFCTCIFKGT